jgi:hypothetical protein
MPCYEPRGPERTEDDRIAEALACVLMRAALRDADDPLDWIEDDLWRRAGITREQALGWFERHCKQDREREKRERYAELYGRAGGQLR